MKILTALSLLLMSLSVTIGAFASPNSFSYEGRLMDSFNNPITATTYLRLQVVTPGSPSPDCVLYEEWQTVNPSSDGYFSVNIGSGTRSGGTFEIASTLSTVFNNSSSNVMSPSTCSPSPATYTPSPGDIRRLRVSVSSTAPPAASWQQMSQDVAINAAPFAMYADNATNAASMGGKGPNDFIQVSGSVTQANLGNVFANQTYVNNLAALAAGTSTQYAQTGSAASFGSASFGNSITLFPTSAPPSPTIGTMYYDSTANNLKYWNGSSTWQILGTGGGGTVTSVNGVAGQTLVSAGPTPSVGLATTGVVAATYGSSTLVPVINVDTFGRITSASTASISVTGALGYTPVNKAGDNMTGFLLLNADPSSASHAATKQYVDAVSNTAAGAYIRKDGTTQLTADWDLDGASATGTWHITGLANPVAADGAATKSYADTKLSLTGGALSGQLDMSSKSIANVGSLTMSGTGTIALGQMTTTQEGSTSFVPGQIWFNSTTKRPRYYDGTTFNDMAGGSGTVTSVTGGTGILVATGTTTPVVSLASIGTAGSYGSASYAPLISVDIYGRVSSASQVPISISTANISNFSQSAPTTGNLLTWNGSSWVPQGLTEADPTVATFAKSATGLTARLTTTANQLDLASSGVGAGTYGSSTQVPILTVDTYGRVTGATYASIAGGGVSSVASVSGQTVVGGTAANPTVGLATTGVASATYGSSSQIPILTLDSYGRVTTASYLSVSIAPSQLTQAGAAAGSYLSWNGSAWAPASFGAAETDPTVATWAKSVNPPSASYFTTTGNTLSLASSGVTAATYGSASQVPVLTIDSKGRVISATYSAVNDTSKLSSSGGSISGSLSIAGGNLTLNTGSKLYLDSSANTASMLGLSFGGDTSTGIFHPSNYTLGISTNNQERLRIDGSGRIGISTSSPLAFLHLPAGSAASYSAPLKFTASATMLTNAEAGAVEFDGTNLYFTNNSSVRRSLLSVDNSGKLGVGTSGPTAMLHVSTSVNYDGALIQNTVSNPTLKLQRMTASVAPGDTLGEISFLGNSGGYGPMLHGNATEAWTGASQGASVSIFTIPNGTNMPVESLRVENGGALTLATYSSTVSVGNLSTGGKSVAILSATASISCITSGSAGQTLYVVTVSGATFTTTTGTCTGNFQPIVFGTSQLASSTGATFVNNGTGWVIVGSH